MKNNDGTSRIGIIATLFVCFMVSTALTATAQQHPSLFFGSDEIQSLRSKASGSHSAIYAQIKAFADAELKTSPGSQPGDQSTIRLAGDRLIAQAFTYIISGDVKYATLAKNYLLKYATWNLWDTAPDTRDLGLAHMLIGNALAFDWIYDTLTASERSTISAALGKHAYKMYEASRATSNVSGWNNWWNNSYMQNHAIIDKSALGLAGLALIGHDSRAQSFVDEAAAGWQRIKTLLDGNADGSWHEGTFYGAYAIGKALPFLQNLRRLQGTDLFPHQYLKAYPAWRVYNYLPNSIEMIMPGGDFEYSWGDISSPGILRFSAREYRDGNSQWLADRIVAARGRAANAYQAPEAVLEFLYFDSAVSAAAPTALAKSRVFKNLEGVVWRTGWGASDIVFGFRTGAYGGRHAYDSWVANQYPWSPRPSTGTSTQLNVGHDHDDMNGFYIHANGSWLAPETDVYSAAGTEYHNSLLIDGKGQTRPQDDNWNIYPQNGSRSDGKLEAVTGTPNFDYLKADATRRYNHIGGIEEYRRHILFVRPNYFLVLDNLQANAAHAYDFVSHFQSSVAVEGGWVKGSGANGQVLGIAMVAPASVKATTGNDGRPWVRIRPASNVDDVRLVNLLFPTTTANWAKKPTVSQEADNGSAVAVNVAMNDGSNRKDSIIIAYKQLTGSAKIGSWSFDGTVAVVSRTGSAISKIFVSGGTTLSDATGVLAQGMSASKTYEFGLSSKTVTTSKKVKNATVEETIRLFAPGVATVTLNGQNVSFVRDGNYVVLGSGTTTNSAPVNVRVTPATGSGSSATFTATYRDANGADTFKTVTLLINATTAGANAVYITYDRAANRIALRNDANTGSTTGAPGAASKLSNSQGTVDLAGSKVSISGTDLVLTVPVSFEDSFAGAKNLFLQADDVTGVRNTMLSYGSFTVAGAPKTNAAPSIVSLSPTSGSGTGATFTAVVRDADGAASIESVYLLVHTAIADANGARFLYRHDQKRIYLLNDAGSQWSSAAIGTGGALSNSQVSLDASKVSISASGNDLTVKLPITFTGSFSGAKNVYLSAKDLAGDWADWRAMGSWTVPAPANTAPKNVSVTPASGSGGAQAFSVTWRDADGAADMESMYFLIHSSISDVNVVRIMYRADQNKVYYLNDDGSAWSIAVPGAKTVLSNGQASIDMEKVSVSKSGTDLTITYPITFKAAFNGSRKLWLNGKDLKGNWGSWEALGTWTVQAANSAPAATKAGSTDAGSDTVIDLEFRDADGATDIAAATALIGESTTASGSLYLKYERNGQLSLRASDNAAWISGQVGEAVTLRNDIAAIDLARVSVEIKGESLKLRVPVAFNRMPVGRTAWMWVVDGAAAESGWQAIAELKLRTRSGRQPERSETRELGIGEALNLGTGSAVDATWFVDGERFDGELNLALNRAGLYDVRGDARDQNGRISRSRNTVLAGERLVRAADLRTWNAGTGVEISTAAEGDEIVRLRGIFAAGFRLVFERDAAGAVRTLELRENGWFIVRSFAGREQLRRLAGSDHGMGESLLSLSLDAAGSLRIELDGRTLANDVAVAPSATLSIETAGELDIIHSRTEN